MKFAIAQVRAFSAACGALIGTTPCRDVLQKLQSVASAVNVNVLQREMAVAFSRHAQPVWLRVGKWIVLIGVGVLLHGTRFFWPWVLGLPALGVTVHFFYRWKTHAWTRPWGGWTDVQAGRD